MLTRGPATLVLAFAVALAGTACGGRADAEPCARFAPEYAGLVAQLVAHEGSRDPAAFGPEIAEAASWWPGVRVIAWLSDTLSDLEVDALSREVGSWPGVADMDIFTAAEALEEFREMFSDRPDLIAAVEADPSVLPRSLRVTVPQGGTEAAVAGLAALPGISRVTSAYEDLLTLQTQAVRAAVEEAGLAQSAADIAARAAGSGCAWGDLARVSVLEGLDPGGVMGEWIISAARAGLPLAVQNP